MLKRRKDDDFNQRLTAVEKTTEKMKVRLTALEIEAKLFAARDAENHERATGEGMPE